MHTFRIFSSLKLSLLLLLVLTTAQQVAARTIIPAPPQLAASAYLLMDGDTGEILVEKNVDEKLPPASLTKMMTSYIVSHEIHNGVLDDNAPVHISVKAWKMGGSKMFVREGTEVPVKDLLRGVIVQSGNDASVALAEKVAGSEKAFVDVMNQQASLLGMRDTTFKNATGWPAEGHLTTARDLARLARALIYDFPEHYKLYSEKYFKYNGINQPNRNRLLFRDGSVDGLKTGHTEEAGFCLVSSAKRDGMRLIAVLMGASTDESRAAESQSLLDYGFRWFQTHKVYSANEALGESAVWMGKSKSVGLTISEDLYLTIPRGAEDKLDANLHIDEVVKAPLKAGQVLGNLTVSLEGETLADLPLVASADVQEAGFFSRLWDMIKLVVMGLFS